MAEVFEVQQHLSCAWVGYWEETGDPTALDTLLESNRWPTAILVAKVWALDGTEFDLVGLERQHIEQARTLTTRQARSNSDLRESCSFSLGAAE